MLLAVNVSNSQILLGGYDGARLVLCARVHADRAWTSDEYAVQFSRVLALYGCDAAGVSGVIFSCVVPSLAETVRRALAMLYHGRIYTVGPGLKTGLQMRMDDPAQLGGELVCCAVAARALGTLPCVAVLMDTASSMFGTASMLDGMLERFSLALKGEAACVATGAFAPVVLKHCRHTVRYEENLLLDGLRLLYEKNAR